MGTLQQTRPDTEPESLADVVEHLFTVFESRLPLPMVVAVVRRCRRELDIVSGESLPELVERLAHQRLLDLLGRQERPAG
jgi:hypothetical protein